MGRRDRHTEAIPVAQGHAELTADPDRPGGWTLSVNGTPQSHVDLDDPTYLEFEYIRWIGHLTDLMAAPGQPLNVLHLGGGAWTLARYLAATRPGSRQRVVEIDAALADLVRERLPAAPGTNIRVRIGDAREVLTSLADNSVDLIVADVFAGARTPAHLTTTEFVAQAARVVRDTGCYAANLADGDRLGFARSQLATVQTGFAVTALISSPAVLRGRRFGNLVLAGSAGPLPIAGLARATASDPFGARVVADGDLAAFARGHHPVDDARATDSPLPPASVLPLR
jgi:Spermine/spermidine synthase domain